MRELLHAKIREAYAHPQFVSDVMKPLTMEDIMDNVGECGFGGREEGWMDACCRVACASGWMHGWMDAYIHDND